MKAICIIRTSTDRQHIEEQRAEVLQMAHADGFVDSDVEIIGKCGASAIKLDDAYMENLNLLYKRLESGDVSVVYAWAVDRIGRDEVVLMQLKNTLIKKKIQLKIKNPSLSLLNPDGSVNSAVDMLFNMWAAVSKQEMQQKKARFHRGKKQAAEAGKHNGGVVTFGYSVDDKGFYVINDTDAAIVRLAFELMATNKYTLASLTDELRARGAVAYGRLITYQYVVSILKNTAYIGFRNKYAFNKRYPRIISDELFQTVQNVLKNNNSSKAKATKHYNFAALLIKCPDCGRHYISHAGKYICGGHNSPSIRKVMGQKECDNNIIVRQSHLDGLLWSVATRLHYQYIKGMNETQKAEISEQIEVIKQKKAASQIQIDEISERYEKLDDVYLAAHSRMTKEKYNRNLAAIAEDENNLKNEILSYDEEIERLSAMLSDSGKDEFTQWIENNSRLSTEISEADEKMMYDIVHKYIINVSLERAEIPECSVGGYVNKSGEMSEPNFKLSGRKAVKINITTYNNETISVFYIPNLRVVDKKIVTIENNTAIPFDYDLIVREDGKTTTLSAQLSNRLKAAISEYMTGKSAADFVQMIDTIIKYDSSYHGTFNEVGESELKEIKKSFNALHRLRDFVLTTRTLSAIATSFGVSADDITKHILLQMRG